MDLSKRICHTCPTHWAVNCKESYHGWHAVVVADLHTHSRFPILARYTEVCKGVLRHARHRCCLDDANQLTSCVKNLIKNVIRFDALPPHVCYQGPDMQLGCIFCFTIPKWTILITTTPIIHISYHHLVRGIHTLGKYACTSIQCQGWGV